MTIKNTYRFGISLYKASIHNHPAKTKNRYFKLSLISYLIHKMNMVKPIKAVYKAQKHEKILKASFAQKTIQVYIIIDNIDIKSHTCDICLPSSYLNK